MLSQRCRAIRSIRAYQGMVTANMQGTIGAEISNLERHLIAVRWDNGVQMYVFSDEIELIETVERRDGADAGRSNTNVSCSDDE